MKHRYLQQKKQQQGFTLLELLVVVSVLATLAGITAVAMDGYEQDSQEQLVQVEMQRIASAIYRFKEDTGYFPEEGIFVSANANAAEKSNLEWLFSRPDDINGNPVQWNVNSGRGWNGPYLETNSAEQVVFNGAACAQNGGAFNTAVNSVGAQSGLTDTFERRSDSGKESCVATWYEGQWAKREYSGQAYLYDSEYKNNAITECSSSGPGCLALVSAGEDSVLDSNTSDSDSNDIVYVLRVNP